MSADAIEDESLESEAFRDALLNGDEKINRLVKLVDTRFETSGRRVNRVRKEVLDDLALLRAELEPVIAISRVLLPAFRALKISAATAAALSAIIGLLVAIGAWPF